MDKFLYLHTIVYIKNNENCVNIKNSACTGKLLHISYNQCME